MPQVISSEKFHKQQRQYSTNDDKLVMHRSTFFRDDEIDLVHDAAASDQIDHVWQSSAAPAWTSGGRDGEWTKEPH